MWGKRKNKKNPFRQMQKNKTNNADPLLLEQENLRILTAESSLSNSFPTILLKPETLKRDILPTRLS